MSFSFIFTQINNCGSKMGKSKIITQIEINRFISSISISFDDGLNIYLFHICTTESIVILIEDMYDNLIAISTCSNSNYFI